MITLELLRIIFINCNSNKKNFIELCTTKNIKEKETKEKFRNYFYLLATNKEYYPYNEETKKILFSKLASNRQIEILNKLWDEIVLEINKKNITKRYLNVQSILNEKKIKITDRFYLNPIKKYYEFLIIGTYISEAKKEAYKIVKKEIKGSPIENDENSLNEYFQNLNNLINIINEILNKKEIYI